MKVSLIYHLEVTVFQGRIDASINNFPAYTVMGEAGNTFSMPINPFLLHHNVLIGKVIPMNASQLTETDQAKLPKYEACIKEYDSMDYTGPDKGKIIAQQSATGFKPFTFSFYNRAGVEFDSLVKSLQPVKDTDLVRNYAYSIYKTLLDGNSTQFRQMIALKLNDYATAFSFDANAINKALEAELTKTVFPELKEMKPLRGAEILVIDCWDKKIFQVTKLNGEPLLKTKTWSMPVFIGKINDKLTVIR